MRTLRPNASNEFSARLRRQSRKLTGPRRAILELMERESHPLTIRQLFALLPAGVCDLATVYRSMHLMQKLGLVKRFDFGDGIARFELIRHDKHDHHHHLI